MSGYQPVPVSDKANFVHEVTKDFYRIVQQHLRFQDKTRINWVPIKSVATAYPIIEMIDYGATDKVVIELVDYSDYFDIREDQPLGEIALKAAMGAVGTYNALLGAAMRKHGYGLYVTELLQPSDNLKFTVTCDIGPSVSDPEGLMYGWAAWRFKFGAGSVKSKVQK